MKTGIELIAEERQRQIDVEGWDENHDDEHDEGELYLAGKCYENNSSNGWPWDEEWWKPKGLVANRVRAGALYQAEIDRLERLKRKVAEEIDQLCK